LRIDRASARRGHTGQCEICRPRLVFRGGRGHWPAPAGFAGTLRAHHQPLCQPACAGTSPRPRWSKLRRRKDRSIGLPADHDASQGAPWHPNAAATARSQVSFSACCGAA